MPTNLYAIDGLCHNAELGTFGHECGRPARWIGTNRNGFACGYCDACKAGGFEARDVVEWRAIAPAIDKTTAGDQYVLPRAEQATTAEVAQQRAAAPLRPSKPQQACDVGLFSDDAAQLDLVRPTMCLNPDGSRA